MTATLYQVIMHQTFCLAPSGIVLFHLHNNPMRCKFQHDGKTAAHRVCAASKRLSWSRHPAVIGSGFYSCLCNLAALRSQETNFFIDYSCFTMLCQFLLYSKVNQPHVYIYPLFLGFHSHLGHHRALNRVPCAIQSVLISCLFYTQCTYVNPNLPIHPTPASPLGIHTFVLYVCVSISALQISSSVPFFRFHIYALIYDICFSLLTYFTLYDSLYVHDLRKFKQML